jgi:predicted small lipoprotein YifL
VLGVFLLTVITLSACGRKGPVRPPLAALPLAPTEFTIAQQGEDFLLAWTIPDKNQDGGSAEDLNGFRVYRLIYSTADGCPTCRDPDQRVADLHLLRPEPAVRIGKRFYWRDVAVAPGTGHSYLVVPVTVGRQEGEGVAAHRAYQPPPPPPATLTATAGDRQVQLAWSPPAAIPPGTQLVGYNLYRRPEPGSYPPLPLNREPLREPRLVDLAAEGGRALAYRVTTVVRSGDQLLESAPSPEALVSPQKGS